MTLLREFWTVGRWIILPGVALVVASLVWMATWGPR